MNATTKKVKFPHEPYSPQWEKAAAQEALSFAPELYPCQKCGAPVFKGYCCNYCHDSNPSDKE